MTRKKTLLFAGIAASGLVLSAGIVSQQAHAQVTADGKTGLVTFLANKFHLNQTDVQSALDDYHTQEQSARDTAFTDRLTKAVTDGTLTGDQRDAILAEKKVVKQRLDDIRAMTDATARKQAMQTLQQDVKAWADAQKIDMHWVGPLGGHGGMMHHPDTDTMGSPPGSPPTEQ